MAGHDDSTEIRNDDIAAAIRELRYLKEEVIEVHKMIEKLSLVERLTKLEMQASIMRWVVSGLGLALIANAGYIVTQLVKGR
jgi:hypothetical protein